MFDQSFVVGNIVFIKSERKKHLLFVNYYTAFQNKHCNLKVKTENFQKTLSNF